MAIKSNNAQGNPFHDESTGQFTSENGGSSEEKQAMKLFGLENGNKMHDSEGGETEQASKLFGVDLSEDEMIDRLDAEPNLDIPNSVKDFDGNSIDVSSDDFIDFLKYHKLEFTPLEEQYIRDNLRLPQRIVSDLAPAGRTYTYKDLVEDVTDFINGRRW